MYYTRISGTSIASSQLWMFLSTNDLTVAALVSGLALCYSTNTSSPSQLPRVSFSNEHYYSVSGKGAAAGGGLACEDDHPPVSTSVPAPAALVWSGGHPVG